MAIEQRMFHIVTEALSVLVGIFLIWLGFTLKSKGWVKASLVTLGCLDILIDGYLIMTWVL